MKHLYGLHIVINMYDIVINSKLYESNYMTFWKRQNYEECKKKGFQGLAGVGGWGEGWIGKAYKPSISEGILYNATIVDAYHQAFVKTNNAEHFQ